MSERLCYYAMPLQKQKLLCCGAAIKSGEKKTFRVESIENTCFLSNENTTMSYARSHKLSAL